MTKNILKNRLFLFAGVGFVLFSCTSKKRNKECLFRKSLLHTRL